MPLIIFSWETFLDCIYMNRIILRLFVCSYILFHVCSVTICIHIFCVHVTVTFCIIYIVFIILTTAMVSAGTAEGVYIVNYVYYSCDYIRSRIMCEHRPIHPVVEDNMNIAEDNTPINNPNKRSKIQIEKLSLFNSVKGIVQ